jgi:glycosyltransferase involved in cell wall biosynthesis
MTPYVFTSAVSNYIPKARVLAESLKRFHPNLPFFLVLSDAVPPWLVIDKEPFDAVLTVDELDIGNVRQWLFQHSLVEASTGLKGFALQNLLSRPDCSGVLYFDPDIVVLSPLDELICKLQSHSVLLTPHQTVPERDTESILDNEVCSLKHGVFNLGFLGVSNSPEGRRFADWWADRLRRLCVDDIPNGLFTDQRWADLAPAFFDEICILRSPVYNISTWNLTNRRVEGNLRDGLTVSGQPIAFYHFSGLDSGAQLGMLDKYGSTMPGLYELRSWYIDECERHGQSRYGSYPWHFACFDNGETITSAHRRLYRFRPDLQTAFPDPYSTVDIDHSYFHWFALNTGIKPDEHLIEAAEPGQSELSLVPAPGPGECEYRVFFSIDREDDDISAWLSETIDRTYNRRDVTVLAPESVISGCRERFQAAGIQWIAARRDEPVPSRISTVLATGPGDFAFVNSSVSPPEFWDLRLFWSARRAKTAATVSPLLQGAGSDEVNVPDASGRNPDAVSYGASDFKQPSWNGLLADCCFVRAGGAGPLQSFLDNAARFRYEHIIADHMCAQLRSGRKYEILRSSEQAQTEASLRLARRSALVLIRQRIAQTVRSEGPLPSVGSHILPRTLHVMHSWGGGLDRWVREYCRADRYRENLVLKSVGTWGEFGSQLRLYRHMDDDEPVQTWAISPAIKSTDIANRAYVAAIDEIVRDYGITAVVISSLIGHSLDILRLTVPVIVVCHDYYPLCAAIYLVFGETICERCGEPELHACNESNPQNIFFLNSPPPAWLELRREFEMEVLRSKIPLIAPTPSVRQHYCRLAPALFDNFQVIAHGTTRITTTPLPPPSDHAGLRIVVLGSVASHKGMAILRDVISSAPHSYEFHLVGCGDEGTQAFGSMKRVFTVPQYDWIDLPDIMRRISPDLGLLVSIVPETFSYTLQELMDMGIPPVCTRIGSFADRIRDGENGFLAEVNAFSILAVLNALDRDRARLLQVRQSLANATPRTVEDMLADYRRILPSATVSSAQYFSRPARPVVDEDINGLTRALALAETRVRELENSLSWKISAPLRTVGRMLLSLAPRSNNGRRPPAPRDSHAQGAK